MKERNIEAACTAVFLIATAITLNPLWAIAAGCFAIAVCV